MTDLLDDYELWTRHIGHTNSGADVERAMHEYEHWKRNRPDGDGTLGIYDCGLTTLPPEIGGLTFLEILYCQHNKLTTLPPEIGALTSLVQLKCSNNELTTLPPEIGGLTSLIRLDCDNNQLTTLPLEIGALTSLAQLYCHDNPFAEGEPTTITELRERWRTHQMGRIKAARA